jgi:flavodoxin
MKILIVVDSIYGDTYKIAEAIKEGLDKNTVTLVKASDAKLDQTKNIDMIIIGSPTHGGQPSEKTRQFLSIIPEDGLKNIKAAAFDTAINSEGQGFFIKTVVKIFGYAAKKIANILEKKGAEIVGAETFFVIGKEGPIKKGELERASVWVKSLI